MDSIHDLCPSCEREYCAFLDDCHAERIAAQLNSDPLGLPLELVYAFVADVRAVTQRAGMVVSLPTKEVA